MIPLVNTTAHAATAPAKGAGKAAGGGASGEDFLLSLAAFLDAIQPEAVAAGTLTGDGKGQGDADTGKDLPDAAAIDPTLLPTAPAAPPVLPVFAWQVPVAVTPAEGGVATAATGTPGATLPPLAANDAAPAALPPAVTPALLQAADGVPPPPTPPVATMVIEPAAPTQAAAAAPADLAPLSTPAPLPLSAPAPLIAGTTAPAQQLFAAAIHAATSEIVADKPVRDPAADPLAQPVALATPTAPIAAPAAGGAQDAALDMRHERWPHAMIDRIEGLRDAADAVSTRIRLVPDALGGIDVSVSRDGDTVHVQFQAEQAATRALLADAQPKLAEIAGERGLRLGDTSVTGGGANMTGGNDRPPMPQPQPAPLPTSPAPAVSSAAEADADTRIA